MLRKIRKDIEFKEIAGKNIFIDEYRNLTYEKIWLKVLDGEKAYLDFIKRIDEKTNNIMLTGQKKAYIGKINGVEYMVLEDELDIKCKYLDEETEICCNGNCKEYVADFPYPNCECRSKEDCEYYER